MKSREEYEASIFAKRDALIAKRKKNIRMATAALSVMLCLGAAAVALPEFRNVDETVPSLTNAAGGITENKIVEKTYDETKPEAATIPASFNTEREYIWEVEEGEFFNDFFIEETTVHQADEKVTEIALEEVADELFTLNQQFAYTPSESKPVPDTAEATKPSSSKKTYTAEEINSAAISFVSSDDADKIITDKTNSVVSRKSDGSTSYTVYFYTADKKITVELNSSLELLEVKEKDNSGVVTQIAPAYNPNEQ